MAMDREQIVLQASEAFKEALGNYAAENNLAMAEVIRQAVADRIGYDYQNEPARPRATKYATEAERKAAGLQRAALVRWGKTAVTRAMNDGNIDVATIIARAVNDGDYESLEALKSAADDQDAES